MDVVILVEIYKVSGYTGRIFYRVPEHGICHENIFAYEARNRREFMFRFPPPVKRICFRRSSQNYDPRLLKIFLDR